MKQKTKQKEKNNTRNISAKLCCLTKRLLISLSQLPNTNKQRKNYDEYLSPNTSHPKYNQFMYDSLIVSLFHIHAYQSSMRKVEYKNKFWNIKNEFFWMSKEEMMNLSEYYDELYQDAKFSEERFVYSKLFGKNQLINMLSPLARKVLNMATDLVKKSIKTRQFLSEEHPEYHLNSWDAGYAQLKLVWKEYHSEDFKQFRNKYKELEHGSKNNINRHKILHGNDFTYGTKINF